MEDSKYLKKVLRIRYEDLAEDPAGTVGRILAFLDISDSEISSIDVECSWSIHERNEPIRNLNSDNISRLSEDDLDLITREARPMLDHFDHEILGRQ